MRELPKGLRIDKGYVQIRVFHKGKMYCRNFGRDSSLARAAAQVELSKLRDQILLGTFAGQMESLSKRFEDVVSIWFKKWSTEVNAEGMIKHSRGGIQCAEEILHRSLLPYFKGYKFDEIKPKDVLQWRLSRLQTISGTSANREQVVLSSIFSHINQWVKTEQIKAFKIPLENPCSSVEKASLKKRERVLTLDELKRLKAACVFLHDEDLWEICMMALKSLLRAVDLRRLESGESIDLAQAKTGIRINMPLKVLRPLNYTNFNPRWKAVRLAAGLKWPQADPRNVEFRDLRKTGANLLKTHNYSNKIISEVLGHTNTRTTELYMIRDASHLAKPLADLGTIVDSL